MREESLAAGITDWLIQTNIEITQREIQGEKPYSPKELPGWKSPFVFQVKTLVKCFRRTAYEALKEKGSLSHLNDYLKNQRENGGHRRARNEMSGIYRSFNTFLIDPQYHLIGYSDYLVYSPDLKRLLIVNFRTVPNIVFREIKEDNKEKQLLPPTQSDDQLEMMLTIHLHRCWGTRVRLGVIIYENEVISAQRKTIIVRYNKEAIKALLGKVQQLEEMLNCGILPEPPLPKEHPEHNHCPFQRKCPRGKESLSFKNKKVS